MADVDPFDAFSDDDDEDENDTGGGMQTTDDPASRIAKSLMEQANSKLQAKQLDISSSQANDGQKGDHEMGQSHAVVDLSHLRSLKLDWPPPAYLGPILLVADLEVGGGRGYVASRNLEPGTLVLVEEPAMKWPDEQLGRKLDLVSVKYLMDHPNLVKDMEDFHPTKVNVDHYSHDPENFEQISNMMQILQAEYKKETILDLVEFANGKGITCKDGSPLTTTDILRLLLALRYNGLESGVYRHVAMFNHDCHPNCAKLFPESNQSYSEVRTTRSVEAGERLTISYVPRIMCHASRRKYLWEQHRFDIGVHLKGSDLKMELIGHDLPKSHVQKWDEDGTTHRVENTTNELEKMLDDLQDDIDSGATAADTWETLKALEQTALELYKEASGQLKNNFHILLIPILRVHIETCEHLRKAPLPAAVHLGVLCRQVLSIHHLIPLQAAHLGPHHFELARTHLDFANGISELLSRSPTKLYDLALPSLSKFEHWSALEHRSRQEHNRVKALYPHDAASKVKD